MTAETSHGMLPEFPSCFAVRPTEDRVERVIEGLFNRADAMLMAGTVTQAEYDAWSRALDKWSETITYAKRDD